MGRKEQLCYTLRTIRTPLLRLPMTVPFRPALSHHLTRRKRAPRGYSSNASLQIHIRTLPTICCSCCTCKERPHRSLMFRRCVLCFFQKVSHACVPLTCRKNTGGEFTSTRMSAWRSMPSIPKHTHRFARIRRFCIKKPCVPQELDHPFAVHAQDDSFEGSVFCIRFKQPLPFQRRAMRRAKHCAVGLQ